MRKRLLAAIFVVAFLVSGCALIHSKIDAFKALPDAQKYAAVIKFYHAFMTGLGYTAKAAEVGATLTGHPDIADFIQAQVEPAIADANSAVDALNDVVIAAQAGTATVQMVEDRAVLVKAMVVKANDRVASIDKEVPAPVVPTQ